MHTPTNFSVLFAGTGGRFERDTDFITGNRTIREKIVSDGRDTIARARRQSPYIERMRQPEQGVTV